MLCQEKLRQSMTKKHLPFSLNIRQLFKQVSQPTTNSSMIETCMRRKQKGLTVYIQTKRHKNFSVQHTVLQCCKCLSAYLVFVSVEGFEGSEDRRAAFTEVEPQIAVQTFTKLLPCPAQHIVKVQKSEICTVTQHKRTVIYTI